jgi:hypothetical protein
MVWECAAEAGMGAYEAKVRARLWHYRVPPLNAGVLRERTHFFPGGATGVEKFGRNCQKVFLKKSYVQQ